MSPIYSKHATASANESIRLDALLIATQKVMPALDALLAMLTDSINGCESAISGVGVGVGDMMQQAFQTSAEAVSRCASCCGSLRQLFLPEFVSAAAPPLLGNLPLMFVIHIVVLLYNAFVFAYLPAAGLALNSPTSLIFHAIIFMVLTSFVQAVRTDPGGVPVGPKWQTHGSPPPEATEKKRGSDEARWCRSTKTYKPDRAHHCRALGRVVLRMDHHCPWLGNTVGFANHKFFLQFLFYTNAACTTLNLGILELLLHLTMPALTKFLLIGSAGLSTLLLSLLGPFFLFHCWLLGRNMTTVEFADTRGGDAKDAPSSVFGTRSAYDLGIYENLRSVLGANPLLWWVPLGGPMGDGIVFRRNDRDDAEPTEPVDLKSATVEPFLLSETSSDQVAAACSVDKQDIEAGPEVTPKKSTESNDMASESSEDAGSTVWTSASNLTDDFRVGFEFVGICFKDSCALAGEALGDGVGRFWSICSSDEPKKKKKKRSSKVSSRQSVSTASDISATPDE